jgi:RNA polymerase sigma-70 factor (ECF subfamily)
MPALVDDDTIAAFRRGDEEAVRRLYDAYGGLVHSVARRVLGDQGLADEATQQTFVQAWRSASTFESGRDPAPWLATIAHRVAIDVLRRERRRPSESLELLAPGDPRLVSDEPSASAMWDAWQVRAAIDELRPDERRVVELQHLHGYTHQEIAQALGVALGTVKSRSFRAHRELAGRLAHLREPIGER